VTIVWTRRAVDDLGTIRRFVGKDNPEAARTVAARLREAVSLLAAHPAAGRPGRVPGTRELVVSGTPYIVPYRVVAGVLEILRVPHRARKWPRRL
jgi:toxin ParE1/3/4